MIQNCRSVTKQMHFIWDFALGLSFTTECILSINSVLLIQGYEYICMPEWFLSLSADAWEMKQFQSYLFLDFWLSPLMQNNQRYNAYLSLYYLLTLNFMICMKFVLLSGILFTICFNTIFWDFPKFVWYKYFHGGCLYSIIPL